MKSFPENVCPKCQFPTMKTWGELTGEQQFLVERLPASVDYTLEERKKHRFCTRCFFEDFKPTEDLA